MMKKFALAVLLFLSTQTAYGVLPPLWHSVAEIKKLIESPELGQYIPQDEAIKKIERIDKAYMVYTNASQMKVDIQYIRTDKVGPAQFTLTFHPPTPLNH